MRTLSLLLLPLGLLATSLAAQLDTQIHWQRSLADARLLAERSGKPLLIALNMDGESASDRIGTELYRDPRFVALTRRCVCVAASVFRHTTRDHDDQGRRIPCPRLGCVTCGEHAAIEPELFDRYFPDGERVAPRHALIRPDGSKAFDLSLCFDLRDIERALAAELDHLAPPATRTTIDAADRWPSLALGREGAQRQALEDAVAAADEAALVAALQAIGQHGDAGSLEALRLVAARLPALSEPIRREFLAATRARQLEAPVAKALRELVQSTAGHSWELAANGRECLLPLLAELDGTSVASRSFLLGCRALTSYAPHAKAALEIAFGDLDASALERALERAGGPIDLAAAIAPASDQPVRSTAPPPVGDVASLRDVDTLLAELDRLDRQLRAQQPTALLLAGHAQASLDLARRRLEDQQKGADLLLADAEAKFAQALDRDPAHPTWWTERARGAYLRQRFAEQVAFAEQGLAAANGKPDTDAGVREALRWLADGAARQLGAHAIDDPALEIAHIRRAAGCFARVIATRECNHNDWAGLASSLGLLGLWREQIAVASSGAAVLPYSPELRQCITDAARWSGRTLQLPAMARRIAEREPTSADNPWFLGQAYMLAADAQRRAEAPAAALDLLRAAAAQFQTCRERQPAYASTCAQQLALAQLGIGMVSARLFRQQDAADALVALVATGAPFRDVRDGCDCDVFDLVDRIFEWREPGPSPVDPAALQDRIEAIDKDPFWPTAIADALLREALRADGRNPDRVLRDTVDAGGKPIRMPMGRPTEAGDRYLAAARALARRAHEPLATDRTALAQPHAIAAERQLERGRIDGVAEALTEAAAVLGIAPPAPASDRAALDAFAAALRKQLGPARPRERQGR